MATATRCRVCGEPIVREPGQRGRPKVAHDSCRGNANSHKRISPALSVAPTALPKHPRMALHKFKRDPHPVAFRWCAMCGLPKEKHPA